MIRNIIRISVLILPILVAAPGCGGTASEPPAGAPDKTPTLTVERPSDSPSEPANVETNAPAEWGDLVGRFIYDGSPPQPKPIKVDKDVELFGKLNLVDESLLVAQDGGLANVLVYVRTKNVAVHPDYDTDAAARVMMDNKGGRFEPHILPIRLGQTFVLHNSDQVAHNTNVQPLGDTSTNPLIPPQVESSHEFHRAQNIPVPVSCNIHPWMKGYVLPRNDPYVAVSATDGAFQISNLPAGVELEFQLWQEKSGYLKNVVLADGQITASDRGRFKMTLKAGKNDLGTIKVSPQLFEK